MLILLILILLLILWATYYVSNKEICSPAVLFVMPFLLMCIIAFFFEKQWSFNLHLNTFLVILVGNIFFCLGCFFGDKIKLRNCGQNSNITNEREIMFWKWLLLLVVQCVCFFIKIHYIIQFGISHGIANDLSKCLVYYNNTLKFTTDEVVRFPGWLSLGLDFCSMFGFICACTFAQKVLLKDGQNILIIFLNFIVAILGGMSSGGRGGSIQVLIAFLSAYLILYQRKFNWRKEIPFKNLLLVAIGLIGVVALFVISVAWVGRNEVHMYGRYIANYIGAQIYNLDYMLNSTYEKSVIFGQETFYPIIQKLAGFLNIDKWSNYHVGYDNVYAAGYSTGNVYTCFYSYVKDFGVLGPVIPPFIFGFVMQIVYRYARKSPYPYAVNSALVIYSNLAYMIVFSFFADKFGSIVFTFNMIKKLMILFVLNLFLFKIEFKGTKMLIKDVTYNKLKIRL